MISLFLGPMFSSKTTSMIAEIDRYCCAQQHCILIVHALQTQDCVLMHSGDQRKNSEFLKIIVTDSLKKVDDEVAAAAAVGIDEGQFFPDLNHVTTWADAGRAVFIAALDGTYERKPFTNVLEIIPLAEHVIKLSAVCMHCKNLICSGAFSYRTSCETETIVVGGADKYVTLCRKCYNARVLFSN